jgi:hypothetical protein
VANGRTAETASIQAANVALSMRRLGFLFTEMSTGVAFGRRVQFWTLGKIDVDDTKVGEFASLEGVNKALHVAFVHFDVKYGFALILRHEPRPIPIAFCRIVLASVP